MPLQRANLDRPFKYPTRFRGERQNALIGALRTPGPNRKEAPPGSIFGQATEITCVQRDRGEVISLRAIP